METSETQRALADRNAIDAKPERSDHFTPDSNGTGVRSGSATLEHSTNNNTSTTSRVVGNPGTTTHTDCLGFSNISHIISQGSLVSETGSQRPTDKFIPGSIFGNTNGDCLTQQRKPRQFLADKDLVNSSDYSRILTNTEYEEEENEEDTGIESSGTSVTCQDVASTNIPSVPSSATHSVTSSLTKLNLSLDLPEVSQRINNGFGVRMVSTASSQTLIYRSIPPRPLSYTLTDVLDSTRPGGPKHRSKTAPVSTNAPEDYAQRFKSRPTTRPKVIEFDGTSVSSKTHKTMITAGFPTARARIYIGHLKAKSPSEASGEHQPATARAGSKLQLQPLSNIPQQNFSSGRSSTGHGTPTARSHSRSEKPPRTAGSSTSISLGQQQQRSLTKSEVSSNPGHQPKSTTTASSTKATENLRETSQSIDFPVNPATELAPEDDFVDHIHNPDILLTSSVDCDDLSTLPRPKKVLPKRELPWVFRYKVKRGMNTLSRIMASKPPQGFMQSSHAFS